MPSISRLLLLTVLLLSGCSSLSTNRVTIYTGGTYAPIKGTDIKAETQGIRLDLNLNRALNLPVRYGRLDAGFELYGSMTFEPRSSYLLGATPLLRLSIPIANWASSYIEGGAGPILVGFRTHEQGSSGFAFHDQIGGGLEFHPTDDISLFFGYRFGHISHAGLRENKNRGIETESVIFGLSFRLP